MLTDYADTDQESESFLALGLTPVFFDDYKNLRKNMNILKIQQDFLKGLFNTQSSKYVMTEYEERFSAAGNPIYKYIISRKGK